MPGAGPNSPGGAVPLVSAWEALRRLQEGNRRFVSGARSGAFTSAARRLELVNGQSPFAVILGCSDSRAPVELIFDQGFGDLFVIRVAGNVAASSQIGSVEFAAGEFGARLVVVLGHTQCGAVQAALSQLMASPGGGPHNLQFIVDQIRPVVERLLTDGPPSGPAELKRLAVRANVRRNVERLRSGSPLIERLIREDGLMVVGAVYSLETGVVDFFEGLDGTGEAYGIEAGGRSAPAG